MFNGMFNDGGCGEHGGGCFGGCNCTWILLIILFCVVAEENEKFQLER